MLETTYVALRSRESAQEVAHFRYRSRWVCGSFYIIFYFRMETNQIFVSSDHLWNIRVLSKTRRRKKMFLSFTRDHYHNENLLFLESLSWEKISAEDNVINDPKRKEYYRGLAYMVLNKPLNSRQWYKSAKTKFKYLFSCI